MTWSIAVWVGRHNVPVWSPWIPHANVCPSFFFLFSGREIAHIIPWWFFFHFPIKKCFTPFALASISTCSFQPWWVGRFRWWITTAAWTTDHRMVCWCSTTTFSRAANNSNSRHGSPPSSPVPISPWRRRIPPAPAPRPDTTRPAPAPRWYRAPPTRCARRSHTARRIRSRASVCPHRRRRPTTRRSRAVAVRRLLPPRGWWLPGIRVGGEKKKLTKFIWKIFLDGFFETTVNREQNTKSSQFWRQHIDQQPPMNALCSMQTKNLIVSNRNGSFSYVNETFSTGKFRICFCFWRKMYGVKTCAVKRREKVFFSKKFEIFEQSGKYFREKKQWRHVKCKKACDFEQRGTVNFLRLFLIFFKY